MWGAKKVVFTRKIYQFTILILKKKNYLKLNEPNAHSKKLGKKQQTNPQRKKQKKDNKNKCRNKTESKISYKYSKAKSCQKKKIQQIYQENKKERMWELITLGLDI